MNRNILLAVVGVALTGLAVWWFSSQNETAPTSGTPAPGQTTTPETSTTPTSSSATITFTNSGFEPRMVEIKSGGKLTVVNNSSRVIDFASDPHPIHTDNLELNVGAISAGQSKTVTLSRKGEWGYHDHLNAIHGGRIIVF